MLRTTAQTRNRRPRTVMSARSAYSCNARRCIVRPDDRTKVSDSRGRHERSRRPSDRRGIGAGIVAGCVRSAAEQGGAERSVTLVSGARRRRRTPRCPSSVRWRPVVEVVQVEVARAGRRGRRTGRRGTWSRVVDPGHGAGPGAGPSTGPTTTTRWADQVEPSASRNPRSMARGGLVVVVEPALDHHEPRGRTPSDGRRTVVGRRRDRSRWPRR